MQNQSTVLHPFSFAVFGTELLFWYAPRTGRFIPWSQLAAGVAGVDIGLLRHPSSYTHFFHVSQILNDMLVVANPVDDVSLAELLQAGTGEFRAFIAAQNGMFCSTCPKSVAACSTPRGNMGGKTSPALLWVRRTGSAE